MGRRARNKGLANAVIRQAHRAVNERDAEASAVAQEVYRVVRDWRAAQGPDFMAVAATAASMIAEGSARAAEIPVTEENIQDIIQMMTVRFAQQAVNLTQADLDAFRSEADERQRNYLGG